MKSIIDSQSVGRLLVFQMDSHLNQMVKLLQELLSQ